MGPRIPVRNVFSAVLAVTHAGQVLEASFLALCNILFHTRCYFIILDSGTVSILLFPRPQLSYNELVGNNFERIHVLGQGLP